MTGLIKMLRSVTTGEVPAAAAAARYGEPAVNIVDQKLFIRDEAGVAQLVADRISDFSSSRAYKTGDIAIQSSTLWRADTDIVEGSPFNSAEWTSIGGGSIAAVLLNPPSQTHNTIDLTGTPGRFGLIIQGDSGQTANLLQIDGTSPADDRSAIIDALGFPNARFGPSIFRVGQASHPFAFRGQAAAFTGGAWVLADASDPAKASIAIVEQVIDANSFVLRTGGLIDNLQSGAFSGSYSPETVYYVSDTVPGQLTDTPPAVRADPVLSSTTGGSGIVLAGTGTVGSEFVRLIGDTMTGPLTFTNVGAGDTGEIRFEDQFTSIRKSQASPSILIEISGDVAARFDEGDADATGVATVITRVKGDNRYLKLDTSGQELSGNLTIRTQFPSIQLYDTNLLGPLGGWLISGDGGNLTFNPRHTDGSGEPGSINIVRTTDGVTDMRLNAVADSLVDASVMTRARGDARYVRLTGSTMTGKLTLDGPPVADLHAVPKAYVDSNTLTPSQISSTYVPQTRTVTTGFGLTGGGDLSANRQFGLNLSETDTRYLRTNAGTGSTQTYQGRLTINSTVSGGGALIIQSGGSNVITLMHDDISTFVHGIVAGGASGLAVNHGGTNAFLNNLGGGNIEYRFGGATQYSMHPTGGLTGDTSVITRATGDARYVNHSQQLGGAQQTWVNVLGTRTSSTFYSNNTGAPIMVLIIASDLQNVTLRAPGGATMSTSDYNADGSDLDNNTSFIVPHGWDYSVTVFGDNNANFRTWWELR